ncbi:unnamed protein product [Calypogeia fissa]
MSKPTVLQLIDASPSLTAGLKAKFDHSALWEQPDKELAEHGPSFRALVIVGFSWLLIDDSMLSKLPNVEIVAAFSAGTNNVNKTVLKSRGVVLTNTGDVHADTVAELAVGLALSTLRKIVSADRFVRDGKWASGGSFRLTRQLSNKRVGIVGLGLIGAAIARRMTCFGCTMAYCSTSPKPQYPNYMHCNNVVNLAKNCDILFVSCPLTEDTTKIINREVLDALGPEGYVMNVSRGQVIDEAELVSALKESRIAGAGLDVFEHEPQVPHELMKLDNCVLQPTMPVVPWRTIRLWQTWLLPTWKLTLQGNLF